MSWALQRLSESAAAFHARALPDPLERGVWVCEPTGTAVVVGSAQREDVVYHSACTAAGVEVVRRRSGGGAVLVEPASMLWVDVVLPIGDPLWDPDVGRAFLWLGETWAEALDDVGVCTTVHRGPLLRSRWSDLVCFAGLGPGELTDASGRKVLGMSQRRTRAGARFQCAVLGTWAPAKLTALLALSPAEREVAAVELEHAAVGLGLALDELLPALLTRLP